MKETHTISAIHDGDLTSLLKEINLLQKIENGESRCINCGDTTTLENLSGVFVTNNVFETVCNNPDCIAMASQVTEQDKDSTVG